MQHIDFKRAATLLDLQEQLAAMETKELLTADQSRYIQLQQIKDFIDGPLGQLLLTQEKVHREIPFSMALPMSETRPGWNGQEDERVLVQGVIDCLVEEEDGYILIDYKTDKITNRFTQGFEGAKETLLKRYEVQLKLYATAIERILKKPVKESFLYFFDGGHILQVK
jgi:ATP-dependent helicase/nuclease subunit A